MFYIYFILLPFQKFFHLFDWILIRRKKLILPSQTGNIHTKYTRLMPHVVNNMRCGDTYRFDFTRCKFRYTSTFKCQMKNVYQKKVMMNILISIENKNGLANASYQLQKKCLRQTTLFLSLHSLVTKANTSCIYVTSCCGEGVP
jgi:hypothetical protein